MKILHLLSNWKWTERSEPAADLALAQQKAGAEVYFVCGRTQDPDFKNGVLYNLEQKGLRHTLALKMPKHLEPMALFSDISQLKKLHKSFKWDVIHVHMPNAHLTAAFLNKGAFKTKIVRQYYNPENLRTDTRSRRLLRKNTDGAVIVSTKMAEILLNKGPLTKEQICVAPPGIDLGRFNPDRTLNILPGPDFGLTTDNFVIGMVTRIRTARRLDLVLKALAEISVDYPHVRLLLVGRGSEGVLEDVVLKPAEEMGIGDKVIIAGYCRQDYLVRALRSMHVLVYPTAGTDKTCRTVREAMAAGLMVIAPPMALLPEIIRNEHTGLFMQPDGSDLTQILTDLVRHPDRTRVMGQNAYNFALKSFDPEAQAKKTLTFYEHLLKNK